MKRTISHAKICRTVVDILEKTPLPREALIERCALNAGLAKEELANKTAGSVYSNLRSRIGTVINEMHSQNLVGMDSLGKYFLVSARPIIIRIEKCETEIIKALTEKPMTKTELRDRLKSVFGTDKTATTRDDDTISTIMGQLLKKLTAKNVIFLEAGEYSLSKSILAYADDVNSMMALKSDFLAKLHSRGGEFFENYFMMLLKKYLTKHGKKVIECTVTAGSADGGIDGIAKTEDSLGFVEIIMVQTKNRIELSSETDVRGFYGAVCAKRGTRGIFAATSDFHEGAKEFIDSLDDCVGINGDKIFSMAIECSYGIKRTEKAFEIDYRVIKKASI